MQAGARGSLSASELQVGDAAEELVAQSVAGLVAQSVSRTGGAVRKPAVASSPARYRPPTLKKEKRRGAVHTPNQRKQRAPAVANNVEEKAKAACSLTSWVTTVAGRYWYQ